jgi:hypothetical protein
MLCHHVITRVREERSDGVILGPLPVVSSGRVQEKSPCFRVVFSWSCCSPVPVLPAPSPVALHSCPCLDRHQSLSIPDTGARPFSAVDYIRPEYCFPAPPKEDFLLHQIVMGQPGMAGVRAGSPESKLLRGFTGRNFGRDTDGITWWFTGRFAGQSYGACRAQGKGVRNEHCFTTAG